MTLTRRRALLLGAPLRLAPAVPVAPAGAAAFSGSTGYTDGIDVSYRNNGTSNTYLRGTTEMPGAPVIHSKPN